MGYQPGTNVASAGYNTIAGFDPNDDNNYEWSKLMPNLVNQITNAGQTFSSDMVRGNLLSNAAKNNSYRIAKNITVDTGAKILGALGAAKSGYDFYNSVGDYKNTLNSQDLQKYTSQNTEYVGNVGYNTYGSFDEGATSNYVANQNLNSGINTIGSGISLGAGIGSFIPGVGSIIGGGIGAAVGALTHWWGSGKRRDKYNEAVRNWRNASNNYNDQSWSLAMSKNLRGYDKGKPYSSLDDEVVLNSKSKDINGNNAGIQNAWGDYGEVQYNPQTGAARIIGEGKGKKDGAPILTNPSEAILGNKKIPGTNTTYAQAARKAAMTGDKDMLDALTESQNNELNNMKILASTNKNKLPKRYPGQAQDVMNYFIPAMIGTIAARDQYNSYKNSRPTAMSAYAPNPYAPQALRMMPTDYDPYNQLKAVNDTARQALYNYNSAAIPSGLRAALQSQLYGNVMKNKAAIYDNATKINDQYRAQKAEAMYKLGEADAARLQQSNAAYIQQLAQAEAARRKGMETALYAGVDNAQELAQNVYNSEWANRIIGLYREDADTKKLDVLAKLKSQGYNIDDQINELLGVKKKKPAIPRTKDIQYYYYNPSGNVNGGEVYVG